MQNYPDVGNNGKTKLFYLLDNQQGFNKNFCKHQTHAVKKKLDSTTQLGYAVFLTQIISCWQ